MFLFTTTTAAVTVTGGHLLTPVMLVMQQSVNALMNAHNVLIIVMIIAIMTIVKRGDK